jgi:hypothetical protein
MEQAIDRAPAVPVYHLNLALWLETLARTEAAAEAYEQLLMLAPAAGDEAFWSTTEARRAAIAGSPPPAARQPETDEPAPDALSEVEARDLVGQLLGNSLYGFGRDRRSTYMRDVFVRLDMPGELLPQLRCPAPDARASQRLAELRQRAAGQGWSAVVARIDGAPRSGPDGLVPCAPFDLARPQNGG